MGSTGDDHAPVSGGPLAVDGADGFVGQVVASAAHLFGHGGFDEPVGEGEAARERDGLPDL